MDATLTQILAGLYEAHREIDRLNAEMAKLMQEVSADREQQSANGHADEVTNAAHA